MRHRSIALTLAVLALFVISSVAASGGWAQVTAKNVPVDPPAGEETTIQLDVKQHGVTPVSWPGLTVVATDTVSGAVVRERANAVGPEGSYAVTLTFPSAGSWALSFESTDLVMEGSATVHVAVASTGAAAGTAAPAAQALGLMPLAAAVLALLAVAGIAALALRSRGAAAGAARVS